MKLNISFGTLVSKARPMARTSHRPLVLNSSLPPLPVHEVPPHRKIGKPLKVDDSSHGPITWKGFKGIRGKGDLLQTQGQQVMLYMRGHYSGTFYNALQEGIKGNKVHVAYCQKLEEMEQAGRLDSDYFLSQSLEGGFLIVDRMTRQEGQAELKVCKLCLRKLNYEGYMTPGRGKGRIFDEFTYKSFFEKYSSFFSFHPQPKATKTLQEKGYTGDWAEVSRRYRASRNYCCEECTVDLKEYPYLLHSHHMNANKQDNRDENLRALCIDCHSKQPYHDHMVVSLEDRHLIAQLRQRQDMPAPADWRHVFDLADPGMNGVMHFLQHNQVPIPAVGLDILDENSAVIATLELAWPSAQLAIAISVEDADTARQQGWNTLSVEQALAYPDYLVKQLS